MTAVMKKKLNEIFIYPLYICAKAQLCGLRGGPARECYAQIQAQTDRRTPGENRANSGLAGLVPGPELSNKMLTCFIR